jgi:hypothetical protein
MGYRLSKARPPALHTGRTRDNVNLRRELCESQIMHKINAKKTHQIIGDGGLTRAIVNESQFLNHFSSILGRVFHCSATGRHFSGIALGNGPVEVIGKGEFLEVLQDGSLRLVCREFG